MKTHTTVPSGVVRFLPHATVLLSCLLLLSGVSSGQFLQVHRINQLTLNGTTDAFGTVNKIGAQAFTSIALSQLATVTTADVNSGVQSILFEMPGLTDLTGTSQASLQLGIANGLPVLDTLNPNPYVGSNDLDWWYTPNPGEVDGGGAPIVQMSGSITAKILSGGPGRMNLIPNPMTGSAEMDLVSAQLTASVGSSSHPLLSSNTYPPGHLPAENLDTTLQSFASMSAGKLKGNVTAASLRNTPILTSLTGSATDQGFTASNSMLDLIVSGATAFSGIIRLVNPSQPDQVDPAAPVAGAGGLYSFILNSSKVVTTAHDKNGNTVGLDSALNAAAYSIYFSFTTDRVIVPQPLGVTFGVSPRWNLLSVPLKKADMAKTILFPSAVSNAFAYNGGYQTRDTLANGLGYWLKFGASQSISLSGGSIAKETVDVADGWNLIGSISSPIPVAGVSSIPGGMTMSNFYGYNGIYVIADSLLPGKGYWVKVNQAGQLVLSSSPAASPSARIHIVASNEPPPKPPGEDGAPSAMEVSRGFELRQNYPNPFNPATRISYFLAAPSKVRLWIMNTLGQQVLTLVDTYQSAGMKSVGFDASALPSGVYFYRLEAGGFADTKKLLLLR